MKGVLNPTSGTPGVGGTLGNVAGNTGSTVGNTASNVGQTLGNTASNIGQTAKDFGHTGSLSGFASDTVSTVGQSARDTANTGANVLEGTGRTVGGFASDTASTIGGSTGLVGQGLQTGYSQQPLQSDYPQQGLQSGYQQRPVQSGFQQQPLQSGYQQQPLQSGYQQQPLQSGYQQQPLQSGYQQQPLQSGLQQPLQSGFQQQPLQSSNLQQSTGSLMPGTYAQELHMPSSIVREKVEKPVIVREKILPQEKIEVQPIIHREREQLEVHEVVQPLHERDIAATSVRYETLPSQTRADVRESDASFQTKYRDATTRYVGSYETQPVQREFLSKAPILEEHISKKIVEEVQPVLYKETITPTLIEETQPIYERVVEAPTMFEEVRDTVDLGVKYIQAPLTTQMSNLSVQEPATIHKETYIKKEIFSEHAHRQPTTESKRII